MHAGKGCLETQRQALQSQYLQKAADWVIVGIVMRSFFEVKHTFWCVRSNVELDSQIME